MMIQKAASKRIARALLGLVLFAANLALVWNYSGIRHKVKIEEGVPSPVFQVAVNDSGKVKLFLSEKELEEYRKTSPNVSFLLPYGQNELVQQQLSASYQEKYGKNGGKGHPVLQFRSIDASRQLIELYMHGDPHDQVFWYEATPNQILPQSYMVFSAFHLLLIIIVSVGLIWIEYLIGARIVRFIRNAKVRQPSSGVI